MTGKDPVFGSRVVGAIEHLIAGRVKLVGVGPPARAPARLESRLGRPFRVVVHGGTGVRPTRLLVCLLLVDFAVA